MERQLNWGFTKNDVTNHDGERVEAQMRSQPMALETWSQQDVRYYYRAPVSGRDPDRTILLLHGLGNSLDFWTTTVPLVEERHGVLAIDIPGFGQSAAPPEGLTIESICDKIVQFLDHQRSRPPVIVGHSLGAFVALALATLSPSVFRRVILVSGILLRAANLLRSPSKALLAPDLAVALAAQFIGGIIPLRHVPTGLVLQWRLARVITLWPYVAHPASLDPTVLARAFSNNGGTGVLRVLSQSHSFDLIATMKDVKQPVDLIWGRADRLISNEDIRRARTLLNVNRSQDIRACGHWPMIEQPNVLARFISEWDLVDDEK